MENLTVGAPDMAAEVGASIEAGAYGYVAIMPGQGANGVHDGAATSATISLVIKDRSPADIAATLAHEWNHARRQAGHDDGTPNSNAEEMDPCSHVSSSSLKLEVMDAIQNHYYFNSTPPKTTFSCKKLQAARTICERHYEECEAAGGTPEADCAVPILTDGPCP